MSDRLFFSPAKMKKPSLTTRTYYGAKLAVDRCGCRWWRETGAPAHRCHAHRVADTWGDFAHAVIAAALYYGPRWLSLEHLRVVCGAIVFVAMLAGVFLTVYAWSLIAEGIAQ